MSSEERESIRDEQRSGRPMTTRTHCENSARVANILKKDRRSLCRLIEWVGIPKTIMQKILREDLQKRKLCIWFMLHALTAEQNEQRPNHTYDLIEPIKSDPNFLDSIITGNGSWCFVYDLETKCQSSECVVQTRHPLKNFDFKNQG